MASLLELTISGICGADEEDEDEIDFCGMPSEKIVEIAIRRDFLLLRLQALVDAKSSNEAEAAVVAMDTETRKDEKLQRFLVRAGTVEIVQECKLLRVPSERFVEPETDAKETTSRSVVAESLLKKLLPYHEQWMLREAKKKQRGVWAMITSGSG